MLVFASVILVIIIQLVNLQILSTKYKIMADDQGKFRKVVYPDRGIIYDRHRKAILQNTTIYDLMIVPNKLKGVDTFGLCKILGIDSIEFRKRIVSLIIKNTSYKPSVFEA